MGVRSWMDASEVPSRVTQNCLHYLRLLPTPPLYDTLPGKQFCNEIPQTKTINGGNDQFLPIFYGLQVLLFAFLGLILLLQIGLDGFVLGIEVAQVLRGRGRGSDATLTLAFSFTPFLSLVSCPMVDKSQTLFLWWGYKKDSESRHGCKNKCG